MIYSYSLRSALNMLLLCVSIAVTATAAFLCNKKQNDKELRQIQNMDVPTPITSPGSWFHNVDRELESLPHQSFVQTTKIHLGERPNLKSKLFISHSGYILQPQKNPHIFKASTSMIFSQNFNLVIHDFQAIFWHCSLFAHILLYIPNSKVLSSQIMSWCLKSVR
jgi:hypothetical protein